jgi:hypothetical protein
MKKITVIFLIVFGFSVFNITQASAGCNIVWTGTNITRGSRPTQETSRTEQAAWELLHSFDCCQFSPAWDGSNGSCVNCTYDDMGSWGSCYVRVCYSDGTWQESWEGWMEGDYYGTWDVICDGSTTTTTQPSTTTTTAPPTLINLSSFTATPKFNKVILQWSTEAEIDNAGFNIYRSETEDGEYTQINTSLISAQGLSTHGASYEFVDENVKNRKTHYYKLEDIDLNGTSTIHGPVSTTPRWFLGIFGIFKK